MSWIAVLLLGLAGGCIGSFASTLGVRIAAGRSWVGGRSSCDHCAVSLPAASTVPLVSYAVALGRCRACSGAIDPVHPLGEAAGAVLLPICLWLFSPLHGGLLFLLAMTLLATSVVDWKTLRLPDSLTACIGALCLALVLVSDPGRLVTGLVSAATVVAIVQGLRWVGQRRAQESGLGFGDVKLLAVLAFWLGLATPWAVAAAAVLGLVVIKTLKPADGRLPFGPFIATACFAVGLVQEVLQWPLAV